MEQSIIKQNKSVIKFDKRIAPIMQADKIYYSEILNEPAINDNDFQEFVARVRIAYGIDFVSNPKDLLRLKDILLRCEELNWSKVEFQIALGNFLDKNEWKSFTRAEFMKYRPERCLKNHSWFEKETDKDINNRGLMEGFEIDFGDIRQTYWRYKDGVELPLKRVYPLEYAKQLAPKKEEHKELEAYNWDLADEYMRLIEKNAELERFNNKLKNKIEILEQEKDSFRLKNDELRNEIQRLNNKCIELLNKNSISKNEIQKDKHEVIPTNEFQINFEKLQQYESA